MVNITPEELKKTNDRHLAMLGERNHPLSAEGILIEKEWQRRLMKEQHELNLQILKQQSKLTKISVTVGFIGIFVGSILTVYLPKILFPDRLIIQKESMQQQLQQKPENSRPLSGNNKGTINPASTKNKDDKTSLKLLSSENNNINSRPLQQR
jgi:hypothetical protein